VLEQLDTEPPLALHRRKQASRGVSAAPQLMHSVSEMPQYERHVDVDVSLAMQLS